MAATKPYSTIRKCGDTYYVSGQLPLDPQTGAMPEDIAEQTRLALAGIERTAASVGLDRSSVVKTTVFMTDFSKFAEMNEAYAAFFSEPFPARSAFEVTALAAGAAVEIDAVLAAE